jgi:hypothetical protein
MTAREEVGDLHRAVDALLDVADPVRDLGRADPLWARGYRLVAALLQARAGALVPDERGCDGVHP